MLEDMEFLDHQVHQDHLDVQDLKDSKVNLTSHWHKPDVTSGSYFRLCVSFCWYFVVVHAF